jgi:predicted alpha/beta superfamily hydrolase
MRSILINGIDMTVINSRRGVLGAAGLTMAGLVLPPARAANEWQPATLPQARQREIVSAITGGRYRILVSVPDAAPPPTGHPVLYALDGNATFPSLALMARMVGWRTAATGQAQPVVVGIGYASERDYDTARGRDYTPPGGAAANEGGADRFLDFIEQELKPLIRAMVPVDASRQALFGHSYGGLCALHALFTRPASFQTYLAASPSIWYGERVVLRGEEALRQRVATLPSKPALMLTAGELEQPASKPGAPGSHNPQAAKRRMVEEASELAVRLRQMPGVLSRVQFHLLAHENHGSAMFPAMARGLEFFCGGDASV